MNTKHINLVKRFTICIIVLSLGFVAACGSNDSDDAVEQLTDRINELESELEEQAEEEQAPVAQEQAEEEQAPVAQEQAEEEQAPSQAEETGEDCNDIKDMSYLTMDVDDNPLNITGQVASPDDLCDFFTFSLDGLNNQGNNTSGQVIWTLVCTGDQNIGVSTEGRAKFDYGHPSNGKADYSCGESWTETYYYQSYRSNFVVFIEDGGSGTSGYQILAVSV